MNLREVICEHRGHRMPPLRKQLEADEIRCSLCGVTEELNFEDHLMIQILLDHYEDMEKALLKFSNQSELQKSSIQTDNQNYGKTKKDKDIDSL